MIEVRVESLIMGYGPMPSVVTLAPCAVKKDASAQALGASKNEHEAFELIIPDSLDAYASGVPGPSSLSASRVRSDFDLDLDNAVLPIWVGTSDAASIVLALEHANIKRPLTHQLLLNVAASLGGKISRAVIDRVEDTTFYATLYIRCPNGMFTRVDARPSDIITLAVLEHVPIYVDENVMAAASCPRALQAHSHEQTRIELEEFHKFIEGLEPQDFLD